MNPTLVAQPASMIRALNARKRPTSIDLGLGDPTIPPEFSDIERATSWIREHGCRYTSNVGTLELRTAIARHYAYPSLDSAENVCITTGSQEAVFATIKTLINPACDEILLVDPTYPVYEKITTVEGIRLRRVCMRADDNFTFDPQRIIAALTPRTRLLLICSPCNPTGRAITREAVRSIADALLARPGSPIFVLHDEVYRELRYTDNLGLFGEVYPYTIVTNSLSKSNALTGMRIGWLIAPTDVMTQIVKIHTMMTSCASTIGQQIAFEVFARNGLSDARAWYTTRRDAALSAASEVGLRAIVPDGALFLWLETGARDSLAFASSLLDEADVVTMPGEIFGEDPELHRWLRASFVAPVDQVHEGLRRITEHVRRSDYIVTTSC